MVRPGDAARRGVLRGLASPRVRVGVAVLVALAVVVGSLLPAPSSGGAELVALPHADKLVHALAYAVFAAAVAGALATRDWRAVLAAALLVVVVGTGLEVAQTFVPTRSGDPLDAVANALGATAGTLVWIFRPGLAWVSRR
jgi:VanZ family protein